MPANDHLNHKPGEEEVANIEALRLAIIKLDELIHATVPQSEERQEALKKLAEVRMWGVFGIVKHCPVIELT